jgi:ATP-binding cassette subfamily B protein
MVLDNINIEIPKGYKVGLVGETASGKSTLADILALLLDPIKGNIIVDGITLDKFNRKSWQRKISYVSQSIFLNDSTIKENIAFGEEHSQINMDKVVEAATLSQLKSSIDSLPDGYDTIIGETGVKLSGGQRQRLAIARALYKDSSLLILDEATSALDTATETEVMESIMSLDKSITMFIIAHRITTLKDCDTIVELKEGRVIYQGNFKDYIKR